MLASANRTSTGPHLMAKRADNKENKIAEESYRSITTILDSLDALVYVSDMQSYELLFINAYGKSIWGDAPALSWRLIPKFLDFLTSKQIKRSKFFR